MALIITHHPTYAIFHNPYELGAYEEDLCRFKRLVDGTLEVPPTKLVIVPTSQDISKLARESEFISVDIETWPENSEEPWTGKDPTRARLRKVGLGNTKWALSHQWGASAKVERKIKEVLENPKILKVAQNFWWFDGRVLNRYGINTQNVDDIRDMRRAVSTTSKLSLLYMGSLYTDYFPWKEEEDVK